MKHFLSMCVGGGGAGVEVWVMSVMKKKTTKKTTTSKIKQRA